MSFICTCISWLAGRLLAKWVDRVCGFHIKIETFIKEKYMADILPGPTCHSCGMPITRKEDFGCEKNMTVMNISYCRHCYWKGQFTEEITREEMLTNIANAMKLGKKMTDEEARKTAGDLMKLLKRWNQ